MSAIDYLTQILALLFGTFLALGAVGTFLSGLLNPSAYTWRQYAWSACFAVGSFYLLTYAFTNFPIRG